MYKSIEKITIDNKSNIEWFYDLDSNQYKVIAKLYNRDIYTKVLDRKHYDIYHNYINERIKYLLDEDILNKEYSMILIDNTMYKVIDKTSSHKELLRALKPIGSCDEWSLQDYLFDLVLDCTLRTGEVFDENDLVFHNGIFYTNGKIIGDVGDFKRVGIEYNMYDLLNGLDVEQSDYLFYKIYYTTDVIRVKNYITDKVNIKIGW